MDQGGTAYQLLQQLDELRGMDELIDFTIVCNKRTWRVHRAVLVMHSKVLLKACAGGFRESHEKKLDLSAHHEGLVDRMITYMYTLTYLREPLEKHGDDDDDSTTHGHVDVHMLILADQYDIKALKELALANFKSAAEAWDNEFIQANRNMVIATVQTAHESSTFDACKIVVEKFVDAHACTKDTSGKFLALVGEIADFAKDVVKYQGKKFERADRAMSMIRDGEKRYKCPTCHGEFLAAFEDKECDYACILCDSNWHADVWEACTVST